MKLRLVAEDFSFTTNVSQVKRGSNQTGVAGLYEAKFALNSFDTSQYTADLKLKDKIARDGKVNFTTYWESNDLTYVFHTGSLEITRPIPSQGSHEFNFDLFATNLRHRFSAEDKCKIRLFARRTDQDFFEASKKKLSRKSDWGGNAFYRLLDADTGKVIFDFDESGRSTKISIDDKGMYFNFDFSVAAKGRSYTFEYLVIDGNTRRIIKDSRARFLVN